MVEGQNQKKPAQGGLLSLEASANYLAAGLSAIAAFLAFLAALRAAFFSALAAALPSLAMAGLASAAAAGLASALAAGAAAAGAAAAGAATAAAGLAAAAGAAGAVACAKAPAAKRPATRAAMSLFMSKFLELTLLRKSHPKIGRYGCNGAAFQMVDNWAVIFFQLELEVGF
jgi:hypothetical protein